MVNSTDQITEVYASTRPYPSWWTEIEESKMLRRRKSMGDTVLERNLCFVDTPGYSQARSTMEGIESVVDYVETQINKVSSVANASYGELVNLLSGRGGTQVDLVFYMICKGKFRFLQASHCLYCCRNQARRSRFHKETISLYQRDPTNRQSRLDVTRSYSSFEAIHQGRVECCRNTVFAVHARRKHNATTLYGLVNIC